MNNIEELISQVDEQIIKDNKFEYIDSVEEYYSNLIIKSFKEEQLSSSDLYGTTGYGYNDVGRDKIDRIFARVLDSESALVRSQFISGTHALTVTLFG